MQVSSRVGWAFSTLLGLQVQTMYFGGSGARTTHLAVVGWVGPTASLSRAKERGDVYMWSGFADALVFVEHHSLTYSLC